MLKRTPPIHRRQFYILTLFLGLWTALIFLRLVQLQIVEHESFAQRARNQQEQAVEISPVRGVIYDRNRRPLAMSVEVESVFAVPAEIPDARAAARLLAPVLQMNAGALEKKLEGDRSFSWVKRKVTAREASRVRQLNLKGIHFQKESKRFYPKRELAAHVLGHVGVDDQGLAGLELSLDEAIGGQPGQMLMERDARRRWYGRTGRLPVPGENVVLTLDENIQFIAERELDAAMKETGALAATIVVQDPRSGEILALANRPTFNPNNFAQARPEDRRNIAVTGSYEPGSTFKIVTMSAAFEEGLARPEEAMDCQNGAISVAGHTIRDHKPFGILTVTQAFENSSDVCAIKLALRLGNQGLYEYIRSFGFGAITGVELPGEARGLTKPPERWWKASIGAMAMGQEIGVTSLQITAASSVIANDGMWVRPHILLEGGHRNQDAPRRVISPQTAARMQHLMAQVVTVGTGKLAQPKGYTAAGKTGTAQKLDPATGTYSVRDHIASFVGFTPVESPQFTILVSLDSPRGRYHGGDVAAPIFRRIAEQALAYRKVPPSEPQPLPQLPPTSEQLAIQRTPLPSKTADAVAAGETGFNDAAPGMVVPNFLGMGVRAVTRIALTDRLPIEIEGNGVAYEQIPMPGSALPAGEKMVIRFRVGRPGRPVSFPKEATPARRQPSSTPATAAAVLPASG